MTAFFHSKHILDTDLIGAFLMARTVRDSKLDSRTARLKLPAGRRHWRGITEKLALGYRRTMKGYGTRGPPATMTRTLPLTGWSFSGKRTITPTPMVTKS